MAKEKSDYEKAMELLLAKEAAKNRLTEARNKLRTMGLDLDKQEQPE